MLTNSRLSYQSISTIEEIGKATVYCTNQNMALLGKIVLMCVCLVEINNAEPTSEDIGNLFDRLKALSKKGTYINSLIDTREICITNIVVISGATPNTNENNKSADNSQYSVVFVLQLKGMTSI